MTTFEIRRHEELKAMSVYAYHPEYKEPNGYKLMMVSTLHNGFYACVLKKGNDIVIAYRGTELNDGQDIKNDYVMWWRHKFPSQAYTALRVYDYVKKEYPNCSITVTGHSLGGSLAQIVGAIKNVTAVTFNAFGTKNLIDEKYQIHADKITNYCNPDDFVATENAINQIGVCYQINSNNYDMLPHFIEKMQPLENRIISSPQNLDRTWRRKQKTDLINDNHSYTTNCPGYYPVSGYMRNDGTKVDSYIRTCYLHGG